MTADAPQHPRAFVVRFKELTRWDPASYHGMTWHWTLEVLRPIGSVLRSRKLKIDLQATPFEGLQPITVHFDGSVSRRQAKREYSLQLFAAMPGDLVVSKIDLKNGALGFVPEGWDNVAVTGHFAVYELDRSQILPEYLRRVIQLSSFKNHLWRNKVGAEGRKEVKLDFFEQQLIPLLPLAVQQAIVDCWQQGRRRAQELDEQAPIDLLRKSG
ncbi:hypothetical protein [Deinococcus aestuarii]|uniref:hypothetical protein n=1 Tax=Deinococcus aestuarii TaxID=2774531 RepID=UPI001C0D2A7D|nr:hypothetical protein [Deinococcus aestuarii]